MSTLLYLTDQLLQFVIPEIFIWILIAKKRNQFSFRFPTPKNSILKTLTKPWFIAILFLLIGVLGGEVFEWVYGQETQTYLATMGAGVWLLSAVLALFSFLFVYNYLLERKWDAISWGVSAVIGILVFILFRY
ncbi:MAG TPA: hypothetical protein VJG90_04495 [Candidatus Nanoarchaeia archaeon]|nr:hypothetical protein [Candidatus Nanoarchaeia archaeon]